MCLICMKCGRCPGIDRNADAAGTAGREIACLKCGAALSARATVCDQCGELVLVPPGESAKTAKEQQESGEKSALD